MYYLRTKPAVNAIQYTVDKQDGNVDDARHLLPTQGGDDGCLSCQA
jgi:hypothetical protein